METVVVVCLCIGLVIVLLQLRALRLRLDALPQAVSILAAHQAEARDGKEMSAIVEAAEKKATRLVAHIQGYHDQIAADFRTQIAEAKAQARATDQRASDAGIALDAACALVTQARALAERLAEIAPPKVEAALASMPAVAAPEKDEGGA
jgi:hypothetical protein